MHKLGIEIKDNLNEVVVFIWVFENIEYTTFYSLKTYNC